MTGDAARGEEKVVPSVELSSFWPKYKLEIFGDNAMDFGKYPCDFTNELVKD